jgi:hypothetical protein
MITRRIVWAVGALLVAGSALADFKPDPGGMIKDLEIMKKTDERMTLVIWLPTEFWRASLEASGKVVPEEIERVVKELDQYVIVAVSDGQMGIAGSVNFSEPELVKNATTIEDAHGKTLTPLPDEEVSGGVRNLTQMMRPLFANMAGALGSHLAIVIFKGTDQKEGYRTVEATGQGAFVVHVGTVEVRYRLPVGSLLPPALDAKTGESFPGSFQFNPYTGAKLSHPAPTAQAPAPAAAATH